MTKFLDQTGLKKLWDKIKTADGVNAAAIENASREIASNSASIQTNTLNISSNTDKISGILNGDKPLVTPTIASASWQIYKNDGTTPVGSPNTSINVSVELGYKVKFTGTWKWASATGRKNPNATSGSWGTTLPANGVASSSYTSGLLVATTSISQNITAPQAGLVYKDGKIHGADAGAVDTTSCSARVTFGNKIFYGVAQAGTPTDAMISGLAGNDITTTRVKQVNASATSASQMYVYAYPKSWGELKAISKDGVDAVLTAFTKTEVSHNNGSGAAAVPYYVYYTGAGALNANCTLKFE